MWKFEKESFIWPGFALEANSCYDPIKVNDMRLYVDESKSPGTRGKMLYLEIDGFSVDGLDSVYHSSFSNAQDLILGIKGICTSIDGQKCMLRILLSLKNVEELEYVVNDYAVTIDNKYQSMVGLSYSLLRTYLKHMDLNTIEMELLSLDQIYGIGKFFISIDDKELIKKIYNSLLQESATLINKYDNDENLLFISKDKMNEIYTNEYNIHMLRDEARCADRFRIGKVELNGKIEEVNIDRGGLIVERLPETFYDELDNLPDYEMMTLNKINKKDLKLYE